MSESPKTSTIKRCNSEGWDNRCVGGRLRHWGIFDHSLCALFVAPREYSLEWAESYFRSEAEKAHIQVVNESRKRAHAIMDAKVEK